MHCNTRAVNTILNPSPISFYLSETARWTLVLILIFSMFGLKIIILKLTFLVLAPAVSCSSSKPVTPMTSASAPTTSAAMLRATAPPPPNAPAPGLNNRHLVFFVNFNLGTLHFKLHILTLKLTGLTSKFSFFYL